MSPVWIVHHTEPEECFTLHTHEVPKGLRVEMTAEVVSLWETIQVDLRSRKVNTARVHVVIDPSRLRA